MNCTRRRSVGSVAHPGPSCSTTCARVWSRPTCTTRLSTRSTATCSRTTARWHCRRESVIRIARARSSLRSASHRRLRSQACASTRSRRRSVTSTSGQSVGRTSGSTARASARWRRCLPRSARRCWLCRPSHSATTSKACASSPRWLHRGREGVLRGAAGPDRPRRACALGRLSRLPEQLRFRQPPTLGHHGLNRHPESTANSGSVPRNARVPVLGQHEHDAQLVDAERRRVIAIGYRANAIAEKPPQKRAAGPLTQ